MTSIASVGEAGMFLFNLPSPSGVLRLEIYTDPLSHSREDSIPFQRCYTLRPTGSQRRLRVFEIFAGTCSSEKAWLRSERTA